MSIGVVDSVDVVVYLQSAEVVVSVFAYTPSGGVVI